jgi:hypothetical protein
MINVYRLVSNYKNLLSNHQPNNNKYHQNCKITYVFFDEADLVVDDVVVVVVDDEDVLVDDFV